MLFGMEINATELIALATAIGTIVNGWWSYKTKIKLEESKTRDELTASLAAEAKKAAEEAVKNAIEHSKKAEVQAKESEVKLDGIKHEVNSRMSEFMKQLEEAYKEISAIKQSKVVSRADATISSPPTVDNSGASHGPNDEIKVAHLELELTSKPKEDEPKPSE